MHADFEFFKKLEKYHQKKCYGWKLWHTNLKNQFFLHFLADNLLAIFSTDSKPV